MPKQKIDSFNIVQRRSVLQGNWIFREKIVNVICNLEISKIIISQIHRDIVHNRWDSDFFKKLDADRSRIKLSEYVNTHVFLCTY